MGENIGLSDYWAYKCRNVGLSDYWVVGLVGCSIENEFDSLYQGKVTNTTRHTC